MIRSTLLALTCLATAPAFAGEPVVLRESLTIEGAQVTLGELTRTEVSTHSFLDTVNR